VTAVLPKWAPLSGEFHRHVPAGGARLDATLVLEEGQLRGRVQPWLGFDLEQAWVLAAHGGEPQLFRIGPLPDGVPAVLEPRFGAKLGQWLYPMTGSDQSGTLPAFGDRLALQTSRRLLRGNPTDESSWEDRRRWGRLAQDPQPHHDWSALLESGGAVLIGHATEERPRGQADGRVVEGGGILFVRVPLQPEVMSR